MLWFNRFDCRCCYGIAFVHTPVRNSSLDLVEVELSVLVRWCSKRRHAPDSETPRSEVGALCKGRNQGDANVRWRFRSADARLKLHLKGASRDSGASASAIQFSWRTKNRPYGGCAFHTAGYKLPRNAADADGDPDVARRRLLGRNALAFFRAPRAARCRPRIYWQRLARR